ncbi:hypothetical protein [Saccharomonospora piscinae]|uniref:hypothetical protein n=1 Tax=Saccharomonospora piscinae TaxID=687388 RepID=UPI0004636FA4|nr:hypothetical protein [Saccharomonospora piscinae]
MIYLLAAIGAITVAVVLWRTLGADRVGASTRQPTTAVAPDDDPDFLRRLSEEQRKQRDSDDDTSG